ncbi:hypothetical protein OFN68_02725 [Campylobacter sp. JMF_07 ED4]|uniref:hypothetical protein n=1 Tax=unclassified Campylobacter TaxID=2593542 RepID=UPI0022E9A116|nr:MULTISPECIES: hypothetical protein [unclassified Campylobacter]MDA3042680.1 hypothetical protein [Campylobacter sp. JMF_09 ED2]MDA3044506.1 hypothetical protein [Campylobacter sp. JMF_07 ED4]MDA3063371.1 hypothetical protein [Campylobacter sp. JMF_11 EL3]MDA3071483.1 hypothetical protein [Campylobacter sp. VBCF_03 NA9]
MSEIAVFLGKLGIFLCAISLLILGRAFFHFQISVKNFFCFGIIDFDEIKREIQKIIKRVKSKNKDNFFQTFKFWIKSILYLMSIFIIFTAYLLLYVGLICLNLGLILILIYYNF